jgi:hypothetical protein
MLIKLTGMNHFRQKGTAFKNLPWNSNSNPAKQAGYHGITIPLEQTSKHLPKNNYSTGESLPSSRSTTMELPLPGTPTLHPSQTATTTIEFA